MDFGAGIFGFFAFSQNHQVKIGVGAEFGTTVSPQRNNGIVAGIPVQIPKIGERRIDERRHAVR